MYGGIVQDWVLVQVVNAGVGENISNQHAKTEVGCGPFICTVPCTPLISIIKTLILYSTKS